MEWTLVLPQGISCPLQVHSWITEPLCSHLSAGILFSFTVIGPGVAFMLGSAMLRFYVDIDKVTRGELTHPWRPTSILLPASRLLSQQWSSPSPSIPTPGNEGASSGWT